MMLPTQKPGVGVTHEHERLCEAPTTGPTVASVLMSWGSGRGLGPTIQPSEGPSLSHIVLTTYSHSEICQKPTQEGLQRWLSLGNRDPGAAPVGVSQVR
jgi:hypothetical protein